MLIEFRVTNFRSFRRPQALSMVAGAFAERIATNTFRPGLKGFGPFLRSAVIYGPNAAGKTNLLRAVQFMQQMVLGSATKLSSSPNPYSPHKFSSETRSEPSEFQITFVENGVRYDYGFSLSRDRVEREWLIEYAAPRGRTMFQRDYNHRRQQYEWKFSSYFKGQRSLWSEATRSDALFLSTAVQLNSTQLLPVYQWFQTRLVIIVGATTMNPALTVSLLDQPKGKERLLPFLQEADLGLIDLSVTREALPTGGFVVGGGPGVLLHHRPGQPQPELVKVTLSHWDDKREELVDLDFADELSGTQVLFRTAGAWLNVFERREVLLFDEIDTSMHPLLTRFLI